MSRLVLSTDADGGSHLPDASVVVLLTETTA